VVRVSIEIRERDDSFLVELKDEKWLVPFNEISNMKMLEDGLVAVGNGDLRFCGSYELFFEVKKILITIPRLVIPARDKDILFSVISSLIEFKGKYGKVRQALKDGEMK
jgi:hypothetical protein